MNSMIYLDMIQVGGVQESWVEVQVEGGDF